MELGDISLQVELFQVVYTMILSGANLTPWSHVIIIQPVNIHLAKVNIPPLHAKEVVFHNHQETTPKIKGMPKMLINYQEMIKL